MATAASVTSCQDAVFQKESETNRISCGLYLQVEALPTQQDLEDSLKGLTPAELQSLSVVYACYDHNLWRISNMCNIISPEDERRLSTKVHDGLVAINEELRDDDLPPVPPRDDSLNPGAIAAIVIISILVAGSMIGFSAKFWLNKTNVFETDSIQF